MTRKRTTRVDVSELLCQSSDKQPGLRWPEAVDGLVDRLVDAANAAGANTSRRELVAAVMAACEPDGGVLFDMLVRCQTITVGQAMGDDGAEVVELVRYGPGRRPREQGRR